MKMPQSAADVLKNHVVLEVECIDRMYLNLCVPRLQRERAVAAFFRFHRGHRFPSSALMEPMSKDFVRMERYAQEHQIPVVLFDRQPRGVKKDDIAQQFIGRQHSREGVMFLGKAQDKTPVCRTERRRLRLHGIIDRIPHTHRYRLTQRGIQIAAFWTRTYNRLRRPGLAQRVAPAADHAPLRRKLLELVAAIDAASDDINIAA